LEINLGFSRNLSISPRYIFVTCASPYYEEIIGKCMNYDDWLIAANILSDPCTLGKPMIQDINMLSHSRLEMGKDYINHVG
jgi:hypothetical protein